MSTLKSRSLPLPAISGEASTAFAPKRWLYLIPLIFITYSLAYLDRANYGFASAVGIEQDLGISKSTSSLIGALFFLGYFFFQVPGAIYAQKYSVRKLVFCSLILWGVCAMATGLVTNIPMLMVIRVSLGIVEAAVQPALVRGSWLHSTRLGALLGLVAYGTYDLSNWSTLHGWSAQLALLDMAWGTFASAVACSIGYACARRFGGPRA